MKAPVAVPAITAEELRRKWLGPQLPPRADQVLDWAALAEWLNDIRARIPQHTARRSRNANATMWATRSMKEMRNVAKRLTAEADAAANVAPRKKVKEMPRSVGYYTPMEPADAAIVAKYAEAQRLLRAAALIENQVLPELDPDRAPHGGRNFGPNWEGTAREVWNVLERIHDTLDLKRGYGLESPFIVMVVLLVKRLGFVQLTRGALVQFAKRMRSEYK